MHITEIEVSEPVATGAGKASALVAIRSANQHVVLTASGEEGASYDVFVADALRQLRRLPEFRRSVDNLTIADGLLVDPQTRCA